MPLTYSLPTINARLQAVANQIDGGGGNGFLQLLSNSTVISSIQLARPCGTVSGGVLTFVGTLLDPAAAATGTITSGQFLDSALNIVAYNMTVGIPTETADIIIFNGINTLSITAGQVVQLISAQITGS